MTRAPEELVSVQRIVARNERGGSVFAVELNTGINQASLRLLAPQTGEWELSFAPDFNGSFKRVTFFRRTVRRLMKLPFMVSGAPLTKRPWRDQITLYSIRRYRRVTGARRRILDQIRTRQTNGYQPGDEEARAVCRAMLCPDTLPKRPPEDGQTTRSSQRIYTHPPRVR